MKLNSKLRLTCIALGTLALSSVAPFAANTPKTQDKRGTIKSVDATAHTLVVTELKARERMCISPAKIEKHAAETA